MKLKREACRPDSSVFIFGFLAQKSYQKPVQTLLQITHLASRKGGWMGGSRIRYSIKKNRAYS